MYLVQFSGPGTFDADMDMWNCGSIPLDYGSSGSKVAIKLNFCKKNFLSEVYFNQSPVAIDD
jgi:hypothetical protein